MNRCFFPAGILLAFLCLTLMPAPAGANYLGGITFDKEVPSFLPNGEDVNITIDYKVDQAEGALIFARPYTLDSPTPGYGASGGPLVGPGTGTVSQYFTIYDTAQVVTHLRVFMTSPDQTETYLEIFVPVRFVFGHSGIYNIQTNHTEYSRLPYGKQLVIQFDYMTNQGEDVRIYARPYTNGSLTPGYFASGSVALPSAGSYEQYFYFDQDADVTDIRYQIYRAGDNALLDEFFVPFDVHWREVGIYDISFDWADGEALHNSQNLNVTFTLEHNEAEDRYAWAWCTSGGSYSPGGVYQGSLPLPAGPQTITRYCRVNQGEQHVDGVRMTYGTSTEQLMHFIVPADYDYGPHAIQNAVFSPASPAIMTNGEHLNMTFDYVTDHDQDVLIFAWPAYDEDLFFSVNSSGSVHHAPPSGSGSYWLYVNSGEYLASSMYLFMRNLDQTVDLMGHHVEGWWAWGASSFVTPAPDPIPSAAALLGSAYPNPFNPTATIPVSLTHDTQVDLAVYDLKGRLVQTLHHGILTAGPHRFTFHGDQTASGVYFTRMKTPTGVQTRPMMLVK